MTNQESTYLGSLARAKNYNALPKWADLREIRRIYLACPQGMAVDHIAPLQGRLICGLHIPCNLQYLPKRLNSIKSNNFNPYIEVRNPLARQKSSNEGKPMTYLLEESDWLELEKRAIAEKMNGKKYRLKLLREKLLESERLKEKNKVDRGGFYSLDFLEKG